MDQDPSADRVDVGLAMGAHALVHTYELSLPILVTVWSLEFGVGTAVIGLGLSVAYGVFGIGALPGGALADRYGERSLIVGSLLGMGLSFLGLSVAPTFGAVVAALLCWGVAASVYHPAGLALLSRGDDRGDAFGYHGIAGNLGIALGPLATAVLLLAFDWRHVAALLAVPALLAGIAAARRGVDLPDAAARTPVRTDGGVPSIRAVLRESRAMFSGTFAAVFALVMTYGLYYRGILTFLPGLVSDFPALAPVTVGGWTLDPERYFYAGLLAIGAIGQYVGGRLVGRMSTEAGLAGAFGLLALAALLFALGPAGGLLATLALGALLGVALFAAQPFYQAAVADHAASDARGLSYGYTYAGVFGVGALGGALAGLLLTYASPAVLFALLAALAAVGAALAADLRGGGAVRRLVGH